MRALTESNLRKLVRQIILEQKLPKLPEGMEISFDDKKHILFNWYPQKGRDTLSYLIKTKNEMVKFVKSLPNGKVLGDATIDGDYDTLTLALKFETSMADAELEKL